jgi:hypothetical protein
MSFDRFTRTPKPLEIVGQEPPRGLVQYTEAELREALEFVENHDSSQYLCMRIFDMELKFSSIGENYEPQTHERSAML